MKDKNLVEKYDDNPGAYFGMLVEGLEDKEDKKELKENKSTKSKKLVEDLHTEKQIKLLQSRLSDFRKSWINLRDTLEYVDYEVASSINDDYPFDLSFDELASDVIEWAEDCIARCDWLYDEAQNGRFGNLTEDKDELSIVGEFETGEDFGQSAGTSKKNQAIFRAKALMKMKGLSRAKVINAKGNVVWDSDMMLKEDKFIPQDKMSKKAQKELNDKKRGTWGNTNPVTRVQPNKKAYDRKRDKKTNLDEAKKGSKVYIAIGLEKGKEPKILGVYDSKEKANEQYKDSKMWVNISEQTVK